MRKAAGFLALFALLMFGSSVEVHPQGSEANALVTRECWQYHSSGLDSWPAAVDGSNVYVAERGGRVSAVSTDDGKRIWSTELGGEIRSNLLVNGQSVYVVTGNHPGRLELRSLSILSGIASGSISVAGSGSVRLSVSGERIINLASNGSISAVDASGTRVLWSEVLSGSPEVAAIGSGEMVIGFGDGKIAFVDVVNGTVTERINIRFRPSALLIADKALLVGDDRGNLTRLERTGNRAEWTFKSGGKISGVFLINDSSLLVTSYDNFVYRIEMSTGHVVWKLRQPSRVTDTTFLDPNVAAVTPFGEPATVLLDIQNGKPIGQISTPESSRLVQPSLHIGNSLIAFTSSGIISTGVAGCRANEKAEAKASALK